jgi:hypothetical protein
MTLIACLYTVASLATWRALALSNRCLASSSFCAAVGTEDDEDDGFLALGGFDVDFLLIWILLLGWKPDAIAVVDDGGGGRLIVVAADEGPAFDGDAGNTAVDVDVLGFAGGWLVVIVVVVVVAVADLLAAAFFPDEFVGGGGMILEG